MIELTIKGFGKEYESILTALKETVQQNGLTIKVQRSSWEGNKILKDLIIIPAPLELSGSFTEVDSIKQELPIE